MAHYKIVSVNLIFILRTGEKLSELERKCLHGSRKGEVINDPMGNLNLVVKFRYCSR